MWTVEPLPPAPLQHGYIHVSNHLPSRWHALNWIGTGEPRGPDLSCFFILHLMNEAGAADGAVGLATHERSGCCEMNVPVAGCLG